MKKIKIIKNEQDYNEALKLIERLMIADPDPDSEDGEKLNLLATLVQDYESKSIPESLPDPVDAILFRMEQQDLKQTDLVPYIGSKSKVSEVLARKRPLTLSMIRSLEANFGIPAKVLLKETNEFRYVEEINWNKFPLKEMQRRDYLGDTLSKISDIKVIMENFFSNLGSLANVVGMLRKTNYRTSRSMDKYALVTWSAFVAKKANMIKCSAAYKGNVDLDFMKTVARLSIRDKGPLLARDFILKHGIILIIEPHFSKTYLDGATIIVDKKKPIIGLTLRHDRLDNFWFNLMHELAHISLHYDNNINMFYDDLDSRDTNDQKENEADQLASEALVPKRKWEVSPARLIPSSMAARSLANELGVHIAIVAGKMRREGASYMYLNKIIKESTIRNYFPEIQWSK